MRTDGERLRLKPRSKLTAELLAVCKQHKAEIIEAIGDPICNCLGGVSVSSEDVALMQLSEFATAGLVVVVDSSVLGERIVLASDNATVHGRREVVYRARELGALLGLSPDGLLQLHMCKRTFGGEVLG